jgi:hypothetical protein
MRSPELNLLDSWLCILVRIPNKAVPDHSPIVSTTRSDPPQVTRGRAEKSDLEIINHNRRSSQLGIFTRSLSLYSRNPQTTWDLEVEINPKKITTEYLKAGNGVWWEKLSEEVGHREAETTHSCSLIPGAPPPLRKQRSARFSE